MRFLEFFAANIRNPQTRRAYAAPPMNSSPGERASVCRRSPPSRVDDERAENRSVGWSDYVGIARGRDAAGEVRPTTAPKPKAKRLRRRPDPFVAVTTRLREWFEAEPWRTSRELFERLQAEYSRRSPHGQLPNSHPPP